MGCNTSRNVQVIEYDTESKVKYKLNWKPNPETEFVPKLVLRGTAVGKKPLQKPPTKIDLSPNDSKVKDQGEIGACTAFSGVALMEHNLKTRGLLPANSDVYSERFVYYMTRKIARTPPTEDSGAFLSDLAKALKQYGACQESLCPYGSNYSDPPSEAALADGLKNQAVEVVQIPELGQTRAEVLYAMRTTLSQKIPITLGFVVYDSIYRADVKRTGRIPLPGGKQIGGHAIPIIGYDDNIACFKFKNSWSTGWGDKGYGYLPYQYVLKNLASDIWAVVSQEIQDGHAILDIRKPRLTVCPNCSHSL